MTIRDGQSLQRASHRRDLEKASGHCIGTPRVIWKLVHGRTSCTRKMMEIMTSSKCCAYVSKKVSGVLGVRVDAQHPRGQGTTDIIITSTSGEATQELLKKVENATAYLKGNYDDFLYKSSTIVNVDIKLTLYIAKDASTDGVQQTAEKTIEKFMQLSSREELNCLYMDDIRYALKSDIETYKRAEISSPDGDIELDKGKVIMLGGIEVIVKNVGGA